MCISSWIEVIRGDTMTTKNTMTSKKTMTNTTRGESETRDFFRKTHYYIVNYDLKKE